MEDKKIKVNTKLPIIFIPNKKLKEYNPLEIKIKKLKEILENAQTLPCIDYDYCDLCDKCNDEVVDNKNGNGCMWRQIQRALKLLESEEINV